jgi:hypothetical protein
MANVLSLALRVTADASGLKLDPVQRALVGLGDQADKLTAQFDKFSGGSDAAAAAQERFQQQAQDLINTLRDGGSATEFAAGFERLTESINAEAKAFERAAQITEANISPLERFEKAQAELNEQVAAGRITQETYDRALAKAKSQLDGASKSAASTDDRIASLTKSVRALSVIEIGRAIIDGLQSLGSVISGVVNRVTSFVSNVSASFDRLNDLSARTGIGVEALQQYSLAAQLAGVDTEAFGSAVQKLAVNIGKATPGDALDKSLRAINLSVTELRGLAPEQQFSTIAEAISGLPTAADRAAAAVQIFGKQGAALAPLFREGAAGIDELKERAERLGIIVDQAQIDNIASMNDAFDLARATVEGIAGQVIGNLAPAVTAVVDQFLKFIEEWEGAEGSGGSGIANAITDVLLRGAEYLAGVFDAFVGQFGGFSNTLKAAGEAFMSVVNSLRAISEGLRAAFNVFEMIGNSVAIALGKVLEAIGSWISSDLEEFGKGLQNAGSEAFERNKKELAEAAKNTAEAVTAVFSGESSAAPAAAGSGAASEFLAGLRERIQAERAPEFKIATNLETTGDRLEKFLETVGSGADQFFLDSESTLKNYQELAAAGQLTAEQIAQMNDFTAKLNGQLDSEIAKRQEAADAAAAQVDEVNKIVEASLEQMRIDKEFGGDSGRAKAADNLLKIQEEIVRVEEQIRLARESSDQAAIDTLTSRLATLDQVAAREEDIVKGRGEGDKEAASRLKQLNEDISAQQDSLLDKQFEIQLARAEELANVRTGSVEINDIRSGGISAFFDTLKEDPAIAEAKKQTQELQAMRREIAKLNAEKVEILAGTG